MSSSRQTADQPFLGRALSGEPKSRIEGDVHKQPTREGGGVHARALTAVLPSGQNSVLTAEPRFVGAAAVGNCAAPGSIGEHEDEDRRASETAMDSTSAKPPPRAHMVACLAMEWLEWLECSCSQKHC